jgi:hypothetical protein
VPVHVCIYIQNTRSIRYRSTFPPVVSNKSEDTLFFSPQPVTCLPNVVAEYIALYSYPFIGAFGTIQKVITETLYILQYPPFLQYPAQL